MLGWEAKSNTDYDAHVPGSRSSRQSVGSRDDSKWHAAGNAYGIPGSSSGYQVARRISVEQTPGAGISPRSRGMPTLAERLGPPGRDSVVETLVERPLGHFAPVRVHDVDFLVAVPRAVERNVLAVG